MCAGAWFLVRSPPPPSEASLPAATPASVATTPAVTLPTVAPATTVGRSSVVVHVAGAVSAPGVYELAPGARVDDAVRAAGGAVEAADPGQLNLASPLADGDRIYVPERGERVLPPLTVAGPPASDGRARGPCPQPLPGTVPSLI